MTDNVLYVALVMPTCHGSDPPTHHKTTMFYLSILDQKKIQNLLRKGEKKHLSNENIEYIFIKFHVRPPWFLMIRGTWGIILMIRDILQVSSILK